MAARRRWPGNRLRGLCAVGVVVIASAGIPYSARAAAPESSEAKKPTTDVDEVRDLNLRAQKAYDNNEFHAAAAAWAKILALLPESKANRVERETALLVALDAYTRAWHEADAGKEGDALREAVERLGEGVATFEAYESTFHEVYGAEEALPDAAEQSGKEIKQWHVEAQQALPPLPILPEKGEGGTPGSGPPPAGPKSADGAGLILGGAVAAASGLGAASMIVAGGIMSKRATRDSALATTPEQVDDVNRRGKAGDALVISGAVATGLLVVAGTALLILGLQRRKGSVAVAPSIGPTFAGGSLRVSF